MQTFELQLDAPDDFYEALINAHQDLDEEKSHSLNQALVYVFANQIGSVELIKTLIEKTASALQA